ncbi:MAG: bacillithiol system redox-active protein YtxJ [Bacteroidota bacterium]
MLSWTPLTSLEELNQLDQHSHQRPCGIYKHSNRCHISSMAKSNLEEDWRLEEGAINMYFLDVIEHRAIAREVADRYQVAHQSPQILVIRDGECTYEAAQLDITFEELEECYLD